MNLVRCRKAASVVLSVLSMVIIVFAAGIFLCSFVSGMMETMTSSSSSNQLFSLRTENVAINKTCMTIRVGKQLDYDIAVTIVYINKPRDLLFNTGDGVKIPKACSGTNLRNRLLHGRSNVRCESRFRLGTKPHNRGEILKNQTHHFCHE